MTFLIAMMNSFFLFNLNSQLNHFRPTFLFPGLSFMVFICLMVSLPLRSFSNKVSEESEFYLAKSAHQQGNDPLKLQEFDIIVAKDGSGDFKYIQDAIDACRAFTPKDLRIFIKNGVYKEKLLIPAWITDIALIGESVEGTIITYDDHAGKGKMGTFDSYTVRVQGNDIYMENITIANTAGQVGQAVALHIEGDRCMLKNCRLLGDQDTIFASGEGSRQYYLNCYIEGTTDFIFGPATAVFEDCVIHSKRNSYITAASTPEWIEYGYVFIDCVFTAAPGVDQVYLGRPWRDYARTVLINSELGAHIRPEGWHNWGRPEAEKTTYLAEYGSKGPGANAKARVAWAHQLKEKDLKDYTLDKIFSGWKPEEQGMVAKHK